MLSWLQQIRKKNSDSFNYSDLRLENDDHFEKLCLILEEKCADINNEILIFLNDSIFASEEDGKLAELKSRVTRREITNKFSMNECIFNAATFEDKVNLNNTDNLNLINGILSSIIHQQESEITELVNLTFPDANTNNETKHKTNNRHMERINRIKKITDRIYNISDIICTQLMLNVTCIVGFMSKKENSLWVGIMSLLIVLEIRNFQYFAIIKEKGIENEYEEKYVILSWLNDNSNEFFEILMNYYKTIPITYKIGEILRDISTLLNLTQGSEIIDKKMNKTFPILNSVKIKSDRIIESILYDNDLLTELIKLAGNHCFDISSDSITTLRCYLFISPEITNHYIIKNNNAFFRNIFKYLIQSDEYVPQRHGLRLLNQLLSIKELSMVMTLFSGNSEYLEIFMNLMYSSLETISFESFHIFKLFIANPKKSVEIVNILKENKDSIMQLLVKFQKNVTDAQFLNDKEVGFINLCYY